MGSASLWHWLIVLLIFGVPILLVILVIRRRSRK
jgi:hypothetical protein